MKIVLLDGEALNPGDLSWAPFEALGELTVYPRGTEDSEEVIRRIADAEIVLTNKNPVGRIVFERCPSMKLLCVVATGYNVVDTQAAKEHGIPIMRPYTQASGKAAPISASGKPQSSNWPERPWASSASDGSDGRWDRSPRLWA